MALDGRTRTSIAAQDLVDQIEHKGSLFWLVLRSTDKALANMDFEPVTWEHKVTMNLPIKRQRRHTVEWEPKDLPSVPLLINKKASKARTRLVVFVPPKAEPKKERGGPRVRQKPQGLEEGPGQEGRMCLLVLEF